MGITIENSNITLPLVAAIFSTKGGGVKSTNAAAIGAYCAESGIKTLLIDQDLLQPSLSSFYSLELEAPGGIYEMVMAGEIDPQKIISSTKIPNLNLIKSNDIREEVSLSLTNSADGALRLSYLLKQLKQVTDYDLILIDTIGKKDISINAAILASDLAIVPVLPEMMSARELSRGTVALYNSLQVFSKLGFTLPPIRMLITKRDNTNDAKYICDAIADVVNDLVTKKSIESGIKLLKTAIPATVKFREAATYGVPPHYLSKDIKRIIHNVCCELFPQWTDKFNSFLGKQK